MSGTVLDSFVVTVGLDPAAYKQGQKEADKLQEQTVEGLKRTGTQATNAQRKAEQDAARDRRKAARDKEREERLAQIRAQKARKQQEKETLESAEQLQSKLVGIAKTAAGMALGFEGLTGLINFVGNLNQANADLGRTASNLDLSSHALNRADNADELAGGKAEDAQAAFAQLSQSVTNRNLGLGLSPLLIRLQREQVAYIDQSTGKMRDQVQVFEDLANAMSQYDRATAHNYLVNAGLSEGFINYLLTEKSAREALNAEAEKSNRLTDTSTKRAAAAQKNFRAFKQDVTGGVGAVWDKILSGDWSIAPATQLPELMDTWEGPPGSANRKPRNNPGNLKEVGGKRFRDFSTEAEGIAAASHQLDLYARRGINTIAGIIKTYEGRDAPGNRNNVPAYISDVARRTGIPADRPLTPEDRVAVLRAMFWHEGSGDFDPAKIAAAIGAGGAAATVSQGLTPSPGVVSSATNTSSSQSVRYDTQIGSISVHTQATDADGIANGIGGAIQRKNIGMASQADNGQS